MVHGGGTVSGINDKEVIHCTVVNKREQPTDDCASASAWIPGNAYGYAVSDIYSIGLTTAWVRSSHFASMSRGSGAADSFPVSGPLLAPVHSCTRSS